MSFLSVCGTSLYPVDSGLTKSRSVRHIPEWMPRISYWPLARIGHALAEEVKNVPMQFVRESMVSSKYQQLALRVCLWSFTMRHVAQWRITALHCIPQSCRGREIKLF
jgi:hypothetical protein